MIRSSPVPWRPPRSSRRPVTTFRSALMRICNFGSIPYQLVSWKGSPTDSSRLDTILYTGQDARARPWGRRKRRVVEANANDRELGSHFGMGVLRNAGSSIRRAADPGIDPALGGPGRGG